MVKLMAKYMAKDIPTHHPPAYYRYREKNPTVSIVLTKETKEALNIARGELTYAKFLTSLFTPDGVFSEFQKQGAQLEIERVSLKKERKKLESQLAAEKASLENDIRIQKEQLASEKASLKKQIENVGKMKLILSNIERFYVPCQVCGKPVVVQNADLDWDSTIKPVLMNAFKFFRHAECDAQKF